MVYSINVTTKSTVIATGEIYHIFNRSVGREILFPSKREMNRALELLNYYRFPQDIRYSKFKLLSLEQQRGYLAALHKKRPFVEIYSYALMPNHHHFLIKQLQDYGIRIFISNFQNGFAKYFNTKSDRHGSLFQNPFKGRWVGTDEEFLHISRYIHLNPVTSFLIEFKDLLSDTRTSFPYYATERATEMITTEPILGIVGSKEKYIEFVSDQVDYQRDLHMIKHLIME